MKKLAIAAIGALGLCTPAVAQDKPETLVTILTAPEPQTQLMAMVLAMQAAKQGVAQHVLLCGPAGDLALKDAPDAATAPQPPKGMSPQGLMQKIAAMPGASVCDMLSCAGPFCPPSRSSVSRLLRKRHSLMEL